MHRLRVRSTAVIFAAVLAAGGALTAATVPAAAATKPSKTVVKACQEAMRQANHVVVHFNDFVNLTVAQTKAITDLGNSGDVEKFVNDFEAVGNSISALAPQVQEALTNYQTAEARCLKVLGLKASSVTPPASPTTTTP